MGEDREGLEMLGEEVIDCKAQNSQKVSSKNICQKYPAKISGKNIRQKYLRIRSDSFAFLQVPVPSTAALWVMLGYLSVGTVMFAEWEVKLSRWWW